MEKRTIRTIRENDEILIYDNGIFRGGKYAFSVIRELIVDIVESMNKYQYSNYKRNTILEFIKTQTYRSIKDFDKDDRIINFKNGLYYLDGFEGLINKDGDTIKGIKYFQYHKSEWNPIDPYLSFIQIPVNYDPKAENLEIDQVLEDILGWDVIPLFYEWLAYLCMSSIKYGKALMLYGQTGTGKTSILNIIFQFLGTSNISQVPLHRLSKRFQMAFTINKLANIFDDLPSKDIYYTDGFRRLCTNQELSGEQKGKAFINWLNRCKPIFSCNELPKVKKEVPNAFYNRWILIPCFNDMEELGKLNKSIREKKYSEWDLSGLLNKVIHYWKRLEVDQHFMGNWDNIDFVKKHWEIDINPSGLFVEECCDRGNSYEVNYEQCYTQLNKFRGKHQAKEVSKTIMTKSLEKLGFKKIDRGSKVEKKERYIFRGFKFKNSYIEENLDIIKDNRLQIEKFMRGES